MLMILITNIGLKISLKYEQFHIIIFSGFFFSISDFILYKAKLTHFQKDLNEFLNLEKKTIGKIHKKIFYNFDYIFIINSNV